MPAPDGRNQLIQLRYDTPADWAAVNPILEAGEPGWDTAGTLKVGNGVTAWAALPVILTGQYVPVNGTYALATTDVLTARVAGDTFDRFTLRASGLMLWGGGTSTADVTLYRVAANVLQTDDTFKINCPAAGSIALIVGGAAAQSASYQEWRDNGGTPILSVGGGGNLTFANATHIVLGTGTGTKIGTGTTQKLGFYNAAPVAQQTGVADPAGGVVIDAEARTALIAVITRLELLGLIATV